MADVFISYSRGDQAHAETIARRLTEAGYSVWWDTELLPHNRFATVIETEIRAAKTVLVIWSQSAAGSQWVRAEADLGREQDKLVQVVVDASPVPLPFNQFQVGNLRAWRGDADDPQWRKVMLSVSHFVGGGDVAAPISPPRPGSRGRRTLRSPRVWLPAAAAVALVAGGWLATRLSAPAPRGQRIAIRPFRPIGLAPGLQDFSAAITDSLQNVLNQDQLQTLSPAEAESLKGDDLEPKLKTLGVGLMFSGTVRRSGPDLSVSMQLDDPAQHATLWTAQLTGPAAQTDQLQARVGALTVAVLNCSAQGLAPDAHLTDTALQAFLHACELSETSDHGLADTRSADAMLDAMRKAVRAAPNFAAAHSVLAKHLAFVAEGAPPDQAAPMRAEAEREARRALELDPKDPDGSVTLGLLASPTDYAGREGFFRQALAANPAWPHANGFLGNVMTDVGRLREAATLFEKAASVNPQSIDWAPEAAAGLSRMGQTTEAERELDRLSRLWPDNFHIQALRFHNLVAQKRWADAWKVLDLIGGLSSADAPAWAAKWRPILTALRTGDMNEREALRQSLLASARTDPEFAIDHLAALGLVNDAFAAAQEDLRVGADGSPDFLFQVDMAPLRRDPRFIALAARYGLVDYWRRTGHWPDFCREPGLPYDCGSEAAKLGPAGRA